MSDARWDVLEARLLSDNWGLLQTSQLRLTVLVCAQYLILIGDRAHPFLYNQLQRG